MWPRSRDAHGERRSVTSLTDNPFASAKIRPSAKEIAMTKDQKRDPRTEAPTAQLTEDQLEKASGGATNVPHTIVSPRDAASGLPTGKRMHKPF